MSELDDFLAWIDERQRPAELAIHNGDPEPRLAIWSHDEPVTLFGAKFSASGWPDVSRVFRHLAERFSDCTSYEYEVIAAGVSGDTAYTVGYERTTVSIHGQPQSYTLRVTHAYRREHGEWKIAHRHGDAPPADTLPG